MGAHGVGRGLLGEVSSMRLGLGVYAEGLNLLLSGSH